MKIAGPIATLGAVAVLGTGLWLVNVNKQPEPVPQPAAASATSASAPPAPLAPRPPAAVPFSDREDFVADIPTKAGILALEIRVNGDTARAYACDNQGIETWLSGSAADGVLKLGSADKVSQLDGRHQGNAVVGTLRIGAKSWDFTAAPGATSAF
ncbi:hypothetical protein A5662_16000 [Mycobacteriaceae bacterium 1482268.1]|nr:hypothetical protein A5662_16000 [Mycobacteriaceae bacterium 1482268.1]